MTDRVFTTAPRRVEAVIDNQNSQSSQDIWSVMGSDASDSETTSSGNSNQKVEPTPGCESKPSARPSILTNVCEIARPSPVPSCLAVLEPVDLDKRLEKSFAKGLFRDANAGIGRLQLAHGSCFPISPTSTARTVISRGR